MVVTSSSRVTPIMGPAYRGRSRQMSGRSAADRVAEQQNEQRDVHRHPRGKHPRVRAGLPADAPWRW
jgi:hypothetical protein